MAKFTVVNIDALAKEFTVEERELARADARLVVKRCHSDEEVIELAREADGILCSYYRTGRAIFEACPKLKVVGRYGVGVDNVDVDAATEFDIVVANVPDYCIDEVADHAMALLLGCNRKITRHDRAIRTPEREPPPRVERLRGSTLGLVALGNIGRAVARRAKPFGFEVIAYDEVLQRVHLKARPDS
jgi:D-3-phosphoglycerate dehydrogenase